MGLFDGMKKTEEVVESAPSAMEVVKAAAESAKNQADSAVVIVEDPLGVRLLKMGYQPPVLDEEKKARFLEEYSKMPRMEYAAVKAGVLPSQVRKLAESDPGFSQACEMARYQGLGFAEEAAWKRAIEGTIKPVFHEGRIVGGIKEYSDSLMGKILESRVPGYEKKSQIEHSGEVTVRLSDMISAWRQDVIEVDTTSELDPEKP